MKLLGFEINIGRMDAAKKKPRTGVEIGETGTSVYEGIIDEEYNTKLQGTQGIAVYDEMRKSDATVRAALLATTLPIRKAKWFIEPASDESQDKEIAEFVSKALFDLMSITWADLLRQALLSLPFGVMPFEKVFEIRTVDGKERVIWRKFAPRLPKSIQAWQMENGGDGIQQLTRDGGIANIPIEKLCIFVNEKEGDNWWGTSILRAAYKHWFIKSNIEKIDAVAIERQGLGIPYAKLPENASDDDRAKAKTLLENLRAHEKAYIIEPHDWETGFKDMGARSTRDAAPSINYHNREIVKSVLAQFLELGATETGSRALSEDHSEIFLQSLEAVADGILDVFNKYTIPQLVDFNYEGVSDYPKLAYAGISRVDIEKLANAYSTLTTSGGVEALEKDEQFFREILNLPERTEEDVPRKKPNDPEKEKEVEEDKEEVMSERRKKKEFAEFKPPRKLTFAEEKVDFESLNDAFNRFQDTFTTETQKLLNTEREKYMTVLSKAVHSGDAEKVKALTFKITNQYRLIIRKAAIEALEFGKVGAANEMGVGRPATPKEFMQQLDIAADTIAERHVADLVTAAKTGVVEGLSKGESKAATLGAVDAILAKKIEALTRHTSDILMGGYINYGRRVVFDRHAEKIFALQRSEILDLSTCNFCLSIDARIVEKGDSFARNTIFHSSCRGIWVEILEAEEDKPAISGVPNSLRDRFGDAVNELVQPKKPITKKSSAARKVLKKR